MNSERILDALGDISENLVREAKEKEPVKRRRFFPWAAAAIAAVLAAVLLIPRFLPKDPVVPPGGPSNNGRATAAVFSIKGELYVLRFNGDWRGIDGNGEKEITTFPTHIVFWCDSLQGLVYFDQGVFYVADPQTGQVTSEIRPAKRFRTKEVTYVLFTTKEALYFRSGTTSYKMDLQDHSIEKTGTKLDFPATQPLCSNDKGYVFITRSSAYDEAEQYLWMDKESGEVRNLFQQKTDSSVTVRSACLTEDTLYFLHSDGALYRFALEGSSEPEKTQLPWLALAFALHGEDILLAVRVPNGQIVETGLILLKPDGERVTLKEGGAPLVSNPAACRLAVSEKGWLLAVAGEEECVYGNWDE